MALLRPIRMAQPKFTIAPKQSGRMSQVSFVVSAKSRNPVPTTVQMLVHIRRFREFVLWSSMPGFYWRDGHGGKGD